MSLVPEHQDALYTCSLRSSKGLRLTKHFKFVDSYKAAKYRRRILQGLPARCRPLQVSLTAIQASRLSGQVPLSRRFPSDSPSPVPLSVSSFPAQPCSAGDRRDLQAQVPVSGLIGAREVLPRCSCSSTLSPTSLRLCSGAPISQANLVANVTEVLQHRARFPSPRLCCRHLRDLCTPCR